MRERKLSRRAFLQWSAASVAVTAIAGCAPKPAGPTSTPQVVEQATSKPMEQATAQPAPVAGTTIQYWVCWGPDYSNTLWSQLQRTDAFKELIGNNKLEVKGSVAYEALFTALAGGTPPNGASCVPYLDLMARGVLQPVGDLVAASSVFKEDQYLAPNWDSAFYKSTMYGVPANEGFTTFVLLYNARMVEHAGLDPDNPPLTWEDCLEWHKTLTKFDASGALKQIGFDPYDATNSNFGTANGGVYFTESWGWEWFDNDTGTFDLANPKMAEALEMMGEFYRIAGPDNMVAMRQVEGQGSWGPSYAAEVQAMMIEGYWRCGILATQKPEVSKVTRATWAPVPKSRAGTKVQGTSMQYVVFFKDAGDPTVMFSIAEFLNSDSVCDRIFESLGWLPSRKSYLKTADRNRYPALEFYFRSAEEATQWIKPEKCEIMEFVSTQYIELREAVYRNKMTGAQAAEEWQKRCVAEYKKQGFAS